MNFDFLQNDFTAGEVTPKQQGNIGSDIYKAALSRMANMVPGRLHTAASRAGGEFKAESYQSLGSGTVAPVIHLPVHDGPYGDFVIEVNAQPGGVGDIRLRDKYGLLSWHPPYNVSLPDEHDHAAAVVAGNQCHYDSVTRTLTIGNYAGGPSRSVVLGTFANAFTVPAGTNETFNFEYNLAGDNILLRVTGGGGEVTDLALIPGSGTVNFNPSPLFIAAGPITLTLISTNNTVTESVLWGMRLTKNGMKMSLGSCPFTDLTKVRVSQGFWANDRFWVIVTGGAQIYALRWTKNVGPIDAVWQFTPIPFWNPPKWAVLTKYSVGDQVADAPGGNLVFDYPQAAALSAYNIWECVTAGVAGPNHGGNSPGASGTILNVGATFQDPVAGGPKWQWVQAANVTAKTSFTPQYVQPDFDPTTIRAVAVYQSRLFLGLDDSQASLLASSVGFGGRPWPTALIPTWQVGAIPVIVGDWRQNFGNLYNCVQAGNTAGAGTGPSGTGAGIVDGTAKWDFVEVLDEFKFKFAHPHLVPQATDALDLKLASPTGKICWLNVLKGLVIGTTRMEKQFQGVIGLDSVSGTAPDLLDHSSVGADEKLAALSVNQKIVYVQRGRQIVRTASVRFNWESGEPQSGLVSDDLGALGEHLTKARIRSFCFLKSPVPRFVFAFDDGTGAIATPPTNNLVELGWSRFTLPAALGGIYSVAALDGDKSSQLWVGTDTGVSLCYDNFESDILPNKNFVGAPTGTAQPPAIIAYDTETPLPPVMDGWTRLAMQKVGNDLLLNGLTTVDSVGRAAISRSLVGQQAYVMLAGQIYGPFTVTDVGGGIYHLLNAGVPLSPSVFPDAYTRLDANGVRRAGICYVGLAYPEHRFTTLPLEGGNPVGTSQALKSRSPQLYVRFVDSYMPKVNGTVPPERGPNDPTNLVGSRVTGDVRCTELGFQRAHVIDIVQDAPLRVEVSAVFGGTQTNNL